MVFGLVNINQHQSMTVNNSQHHSTNYENRRCKMTKNRTRENMMISLHKASETCISTQSISPWKPTDLSLESAAACWLRSYCLHAMRTYPRLPEVFHRQPSPKKRITWACHLSTVRQFLLLPGIDLPLISAIYRPSTICKPGGLTARTLS